jgi:hypothetical protein
MIYVEEKSKKMRLRYCDDREKYFQHMRIKDVENIYFG